MSGSFFVSVRIDLPVTAKKSFVVDPVFGTARKVAGSGDLDDAGGV